MTTFEIPISDLRENPKNPRKDLGDLTELVNSIKRNGIRQNLVVTPILNDDGEETDTYRIIAGHRRFAAAKRAHLVAVPCGIVRDLDESDEVMAMLEENMQRRNLSPMEEGQGVQMCLDLGISMEKLEHRTGLSEQTLKHRAEIAKLDPEIYEEKDDVFQLNIHALYALEKIKDVNKRNEILKEATDNQNLMWRAKNAYEQEKKDEYKAAIIEYLEHEGIFKAPDGVCQWSSGWKNLGNIDYSDDFCGKAARKLIKEIKETMKINIMDETVDYMVQNYGSQIYILHKKEEEEEGEEENDNKSSSRSPDYKKRDRIRSQMREIWNGFKKEAVGFCKDIIEGKYTCPKGKEREILEAIWPIMVSNDVLLNWEEIEELYEDDIPDDDQEVDEFNDQIEEKVKNFTLMQSFIAILGTTLKSKQPFAWDGEYMRNYAEEIKDGIKILEEFGYSMSNAEQIQILEGFHTLYEEAADA